MSSNLTLRRFNGFITNEKTQDYLSQVLGSKKETFVSALTSLVANNTNLQACEPATLMYSAIKSTALGLPLDNNLGFAYVIPYKNTKKGVTEAQFQIGYKGFIQLAMRSGQFKTINVTDVRSGELKGNNRLTGELEFEWIDDDKRDKTKVIGYVAYFKLINGFEKSMYMTIEQINKHAKRYSKTFGSKYGNWTTDFDSMASKTVLKLLLSKYAPMNVQHIHTAIKYDQAVIRGDDDAQYVDNANEIKINDDTEEIDRAFYFIEQAKTKADIQRLRNELSPDILDSLAQDLDDKENSLEK